MGSGKEQKTAIIVGAGAGGIASAARLAKAGFKVTVVEKNDYTGGRCSLLHKDGYRFDQGPSLLLLPELFREAFTDLDTSLEAEGVELLKCEPNYNLWFSDGECFKLSTDTALMKREIEKWEGKDGFERYLGFLQESHRHYEISVREVLKKNFTSLLSMTRLSFVKDVFTLHPFESIYSRASKYFYTERLRRAFTFGSMYMGMSPFDAPGTYSLLQYTELAEGIWYPRGGFNAVMAALVRVGERYGVKYRLNKAVKSVDIDQNSGKATGITLSSGETLTADVVLINADLVYAYNNLLPPSSYAKSLSSRPASCSSISFYWALDRKFPSLTTHNIFLADDYRESFDKIFKEQLLPTQPSFYVNVPSRIDASASPAGTDSVVVLVPCGHLLEPFPATGTTLSDTKGLPKTQDWDALVSIARTTVIATIKARLGIDLGPHIKHELLNTPLTWKDAFNLDKGAILGLSHSFFNVLSFRPKTKHPKYERLFFVGASTHPGTGVPICLAGAKVVSEQVLGEFGVQVPWQSGKKVERIRAGGIDENMGGESTFLNVLLLLLSVLMTIGFAIWVMIFFPGATEGMLSLEHWMGQGEGV